MDLCPAQSYEDGARVSRRYYQWLPARHTRRKLALKKTLMVSTAARAFSSDSSLSGAKVDGGLHRNRSERPSSTTGQD